MFGLASFKEMLEESGQSPELLKIKEEMKKAAESIGSTDVASGTPEALSALYDQASSDINDAFKTLNEKAKEVEPKLVSFQEEIGKVMSGQADAAVGLNELLKKAKFPPGKEIPTVEGTLSKLGDALGSGLSSAGKVLGGIQADPAKIIPNYKFTEYDEDGNVMAELHGLPAIAAAVDEKAEMAIAEFTAKFPAATTKSNREKDSAIFIAAGIPVPERFKGFPQTDILTDPATGRQIVYETVNSMEGTIDMVPKGSSDLELFKENYKKAMEQQKVAMEKAIGEASQHFSAAAQGLQDSIKKLAELNVEAPTSSVAPKEIFAPIVDTDETTGQRININKMTQALTKVVDVGVPILSGFAKSLGSASAGVSGEPGASKLPELKLNSGPGPSNDSLNDYFKSRNIPIKLTEDAVEV